MYSSLPCTHWLKKKPFSLMHNFNEAININFRKSPLLNTCPFNTAVCDKMGSTHKRLLHTKVWCLEKKHLCNFFCFWGLRWISHFSFHEMPFLLENITDTHYTDQTCVFDKNSQKWYKWACHFKENDWQYLLPLIKVSFRAQIRILEIYLPGLESFPELMNPVVILTNRICFDIVV